MNVMEKKNIITLNVMFFQAYFKATTTPYMVSFPNVYH